MIILGTNSIKDTGFDVANSLRQNRADSSFLSKTFSTDGTHHDKGTISVWVKRSETGAEAMIYSAGASGREFIRFETNDTLTYRSLDEGFHLNTNRVFRDISAWYHIVVAFDSSQSTASNRQKIYVNGVQETSFATETYQPNQNTDHKILSAELQRLGKDSEQNGPYANCYYCEVVGIDGQQLAPDQFGEFDEDSNIWKPKDVSGLTFGTNGFYLDFEDSSALGNDVSGNNNDFANTNFAATDQSTDTCTLNYNVMNPLDNFYSGATFSEGNIKISSARYAGVTSTFALTKGKWYFEYKCVSRSGTSGFVGITSATATATNYEFGNQSGENVGYSVSLHNGSVYGNGGQVAASGTFETINGGDFGMVALDFDNNKMYFGRNGTWGNSQNPANGTNALSIVAVTQGASGHWRIYVGGETNNATVFEMNFGSPPYAISSGNTDGDGYGNFEYEVPNSYFSLNSKNLAEYG